MAHKIAGRYKGGRDNIHALVKDIDAQNARVKQSNSKSFISEVGSIARYYHKAIYNDSSHGYKNVLPKKTGVSKYGRATKRCVDGVWIDLN